MNKCFHCGKGAIFGTSHTHHRGVAGGRWKKRAQKTPRVFRPNLQPVMIKVKGEGQRVKLCTKCLKRIRYDIEHGQKPFVTLAQHLQEIPVSKPQDTNQKIPSSNA